MRKLGLVATYYICDRIRVSSVLLSSLHSFGLHKRRLTNRYRISVIDCLIPLHCLKLIFLVVGKHEACMQQRVPTTLSTIETDVRVTKASPERTLCQGLHLNLGPKIMFSHVCMHKHRHKDRKECCQSCLF